MSREVDERVVQMRFDNAQFEHKVDKTIRSLEELNDSLQLKGAEKGFEMVQDAADELDFVPAMTAVEKLTDKFSALEVIGVTTLVRLTEKVEAAAERMIKSLSIDNVADGWNKYAQKTASVQTIVNATGKSVRRVNTYLDKLMWYADETSYGFNDMTASLGQLTAAGGDIDKVIPMIMGIANATAYAGKGASEFSRVIYNLNQSYSQGYLSLMDWKSVELAGVATAELKQLLIDTAVEQGKLQEGEVTIGTFGSTLSNRWADKDVMEQGFGKLAEFTEAVKAAQEAYEAKGISKTASQVIDELADQYDEAAVKAFRAAQEAKSFAEAMDATKEAVASGWLETFEIIFGNYDEAKKFWTGLANELWELFAGGAANRNNWLLDVFDSGLDKMLRDTGLAEDYEATLRQVLLSTGTLTEEAIAEAGSFGKALQGSGVSAEQLTETVDILLEQLTELSRMSDEELEALGTDTEYIDRDAVEEQLALYTAVAEALNSGELSLESYAAEMDRGSGREHFFNGILNILQGIESVMGPIGDAFAEVFYADGGGMRDLLEGFEAVTGRMRLSEGTAVKLKKAFKGVFSIVNIGLKGLRVAGKVAGAALETVLNILEPVADLLMSGVAAIGDWLTMMAEALGQAEDLADVVDILAGGLGLLVEPLKNAWNAFWAFLSGKSLSDAKQSFGIFGTIAETVCAVMERMGPVGEGLLTVLGALFGLIGGTGAAAWNSFSGLLGGIELDADHFKQLTMEALEWLKEAFTKLPQEAEKVMLSFGASMAGVFEVIGAACMGAGAAVAEFFNLQNGVDLYRLLALIDVAALALAIWGVSKAMKALSSSVKAVISNPLTDLLNSLKGAVDAWKNTHTANNFAGIAKSLSVSVAVISASIWALSTIEDGEKLKDSLQAIFDAMLMMTLVVALLANIKMDGIQTTKILGTLTAVGIGMAGIGLAMNTVYSAVAKFGEMHTRALENGVNAVWYISLIMTKLMGTLSVAGWLFDADFLKMGAGMMLAAGGITIMANAVIKISAAIGALAKLTDGGTLFAAGGSVSLVIFSITALIGVISQMDWGGVAKTVLSKVPGMLSFAGSVVILAAGVAGMAGAVYLLANTCKKLSEAVNEDGGQGLAIALVSIIGIMGSAKLLELANTKDVMEAAGSTVLIAGAMLILAQALRVITETLEGVDTKTAIAACTVGIVGLMALLAVVNQLPKNALGKLDDLTGIALKLAGMLMILTPALKLLGLVSFAEAMTGVVTITGILAALMGVGALMGNFPIIAVGLELLSVALKKLAEAFSVFAGGALKAALFVGAFAILSNFAGPICEAITTAAPDIEKALVSIVQVIANVLTASAPYLVTIITTVFAILWDSIIGCLKYIWEGNGENGIKYALEALFGKIGEFLKEQTEKIRGSIDWADILLGKRGSPTRMIANGIWMGMESNADPMGLNNAERAAENAGEMVAKGLANGAEAQQEALTEAGTKVMTTLLTAAEDQAEISSPSKVTYQDGVWLALGLANGLTSEEGLSAVRTGALTMVQAVQTTVTDEFGIHSPSLWMIGIAGFLVSGLVTGLMGQKAEAADAMGEVNSAMMETTENAEAEYYAAGEANGKAYAQGMKDGAAANELELENGLKDLEEPTGLTGSDWMNQAAGGKTNLLETGKNTVTEAVKDLLGDAEDRLKAGGVGEMLTNLQSIFKPKVTDPDGLDTTGSGLTSTKTLADQLEEKYKTKLDANKLLSDTVNEEYELWKAENQYSASTDDLLAKKAENAAENIKHQTDRVAIAQAKYDELTSKWGKDKEETKEAYLALLQEQTSLAELKAEQYVAIFEEVAKRYDTDLETLEKEFDLWTAQNEKDASRTDKIRRESEYLTAELAVREKQLANAEEQYQKLSDEVGKEDLRTKEAYLDWLDAQTEHQQLQTELARKELELIEADLELVANRQNRRQSQLSLMKTAFDDGSLASREDDYKAAVEEYGEDSPEARKAQWQGTTSSILSVVSALESMSYQMAQVESYQRQLESGLLTPEQAEQAEQSILAAQTSFVNYAGALADALDLEDTGKQVTLKLAYAVEKNWTVLSNGVESAFGQLKKKAPKAAESLSKAFGTALSEEGILIGTEVVSTLNHMMQGDWANALASGFNVLLDFAATDGGQKALANFMGMLGQLGEAGGLAGLGGLVSGAGGLAALLPELLPVAAVIGGIAAGVAGIAALVKKHRERKESAGDAGIEFAEEYAKSIEEGSSIVEEAVKGMTDTALGIATEAARTLDAALSAEEDNSPCITPVVDMGNVWQSAEEADKAFAAREMSLNAQTSTRMAGSIQGKQNIQNGVVSQSNAELLSAISGLGDHMDSVAENIKGMQMVVDGNKAIGYIDTKLGERTRRNTR